MEQEFAADRYIVRVRRLADLSQRGLADALGVSKSFVDRVESGSGNLGVTTFVRMLDLAHLRLAVVDRDGYEVEPVAEDVVRDNAGRRFPAHLDVDPPDLVPSLRRLMPRYDRPPARGWYRQRPERDRLRARVGDPGDHPTVSELALREVELARERAARRRAVRPAWTLAECECDTACWVGTTCEADCPCQCEPEQLVEPA